MHATGWPGAPDTLVAPVGLAAPLASGSTKAYTWRNRVTRAKFYLSALTLLPGKDSGIRLEFRAVARGDRNASWAKATPDGTLTMTVNNPAAVEWWDRFMRSARDTGKSPEVFLDIAPSDDGWPGDGHLFRLSSSAEGEYGHGMCAECGQAKDADTWAYDEKLRKSVPAGKAHPAG